ncbi:MAG: heavy-metal-associated domain-containing protein [Actinomycetota bacterium]|nr:heavy-metal-associated domain-containing protein [Actinomycetota bacterium]
MSGTAVRVAVGGMTCPTCEESLERALGRLPGVRTVSADHRAGAVELRFDSDPDRGAIRQAVEDAGYDLEGFGPGGA